MIRRNNNFQTGYLKDKEKDLAFKLFKNKQQRKVIQISF